MSLLNLLKTPAARVPAPWPAEGEIIDLPDPDEVVIPLEYPGRLLFSPVVKEGDEVARNQVVGRSKLGNCVHASISGRVREIRTLWTSGSFRVPAVVIERGDAPALTPQQLLARENMEASSAQRLDLLKLGGVISPWTTPGVNHGEEDVAGYPEIRHIVIKGLNEEPTIANFETLLRENAEKLKSWSARLREVVPAAKIHLLVRASLADWARGHVDEQVDVVAVGDSYGKRLERVIVPKITGIEVPNTDPWGKHGIAVLSMEHAQTAVEALDGVPFVRKTITLAGAGLDRPVTLRAPMGTTLRDLLASQGLEMPEGGRLILGGPMKGEAQYSDESPLCKFCHGVYLLDREELPSEINLTCINCGRCAQACPANLQVHLIGRYVEFEQILEARQYQPQACHECGLCAFVCPSHRPLVQLVKIAKKYGE